MSTPPTPKDGVYDPENIRRANIVRRKVAETVNVDSAAPQASLAQPVQQPSVASHMPDAKKLTLAAMAVGGTLYGAHEAGMLFAGHAAPAPKHEIPAPAIHHHITPEQAEHRHKMQSSTHQITVYATGEMTGKAVKDLQKTSVKLAKETQAAALSIFKELSHDAHEFRAGFKENFAKPKHTPSKGGNERG